MIAVGHAKRRAKSKTVATVREMTDLFPETNMIGAAYVLAGKKVSVSIKIDLMEYDSRLSGEKVIVENREVLSTGEAVCKVSLMEPDNSPQQIYVVYEDWLKDIHEETEYIEENYYNYNGYKEWANKEEKIFDMKYRKEKYAYISKTLEDYIEKYSDDE